MMTQFVYWYAPLWQVVMVVATGILLVFVLLWLVRQQPDVSAALTSVDPALGQQPVLYFDRARGMIALNDGGQDLLEELQGEDQRKLHALLDVLLEAQSEAHTIQEATILSDQMVVAIPIVTTSNAVTSVLALIVSQAALVQLEKPDDVTKAGSASDDRDWYFLGEDFAIHLKRALTRVKPSASPGIATDWQDYTLSAAENQLLRYLLNHTDTLQPSEVLFRLLWPQDKVDALGLRPDQGDRLRRVVFTLRQKIEPNARIPRYLCTVHGVGYIMHAKIQGELP